MSLFQFLASIIGSQEALDPMEIDDEPLLGPDEFLHIKSTISSQTVQFYLNFLRESCYQHIPDKYVDVDRLFSGKGKTRTKNGKEEDGPGWYDDEIITAFMTALEQRSHGKVAVLNSLNVAQENFLTKLKENKPNLLRRLRAAESILCPIYINGNHFGLIIIKNEKSHFKITCLDSKNWLDMHNPFLDFAKRLVNILSGRNGLRVEYSSMRVPIQKGSNDCGPAVCYYAHMYCQGADIEAFSAFANHKMDYGPFRKQVAKTLFETSVKPPVKNYAPAYKRAKVIITSTPNSPRRNPASPRRVTCKA